MANTSGEKELKTAWPVVSGLDADSKHTGRQLGLSPQGKYGLKSTVPNRSVHGIR